MRSKIIFDEGGIYIKGQSILKPQFDRLPSDLKAYFKRPKKAAQGRIFYEIETSFKYFNYAKLV